MTTHGLSRKRTLDLCQDTCLTVTAFGRKDQKGPSVGSFNCDCITCLMLILKTISQFRLMDLITIYKSVLQGKVKNESNTKLSP